MKLKKFICILISFCFVSSFLTGCTIKQNKLVILDSSNNSSVNVDSKIELSDIDQSKDNISVQKSQELLKNIPKEIIPLSFNKNFSYLIGYAPSKNVNADIRNQNLILGNYTQFVDLYVFKPESGEKTIIGQFLSLRTFSFDESGQSFAFIDGNNNIYIYKIQSGLLHLLSEGTNKQINKSISWSKDGSQLEVNDTSVFDVASAELISVAVYNYMPFVKKAISDDYYIVSMKNNEYKNFIAIYNYANKAYKSIANGKYCDSNMNSLLYINNENNNLSLIDLKSLENVNIESSPVYSCAILKQSGEVIYTKLNENITSSKRYELIKYSPITRSRIITEVETPTFYLSPSSDNLNFICEIANKSLSIDPLSFSITQNTTVDEENELYSIKTKILQMFILDNNFKDSYEKYVKSAELIYMNSTTPIIQDALENKLLDFKRFNNPLPQNQNSYGIPEEISIKSIKRTKTRASMVLSTYWTNSIELEKVNNSWKIIGFSTFPNSTIYKEVQNVVSLHLKDIKNHENNAATELWGGSKNNPYYKEQKKIITGIISEAEKYSMTIGEISFWNSKEKRRADSEKRADAAIAKIILKSETKTMKYKLELRKNNEGVFQVFRWNTDPLSVSQFE